MIIKDALADASQRLQAVSDSARLDAEVLLCHLLHKNRAYLLTWPEQLLDDTQLQAFNSYLERRLQGEPIAHIIGEREFWSLALKVSEHTLIPRPDTELLVEQILADYPPFPAIDLVDLGTGSGAIALAIASERPLWRIVATDASAQALAIACENASALNIENIEFLLGNWFQPLTQRQFDVIVSNPPYIPENDPHLHQGDVRFEPKSALAAGADGLDDIRIIAKQARNHLKPGGLLIIEHGYDQKESVLDIFIKTGYQKIKQHHDISVNPRTTSGIFSI